MLFLDHSTFSHDEIRSIVVLCR